MSVEAEKELELNIADNVTQWWKDALPILRPSWRQTRIDRKVMATMQQRTSRLMMTRSKKRVYDSSVSVVYLVLIISSFQFLYRAQPEDGNRGVARCNEDFVFELLLQQPGQQCPDRAV